MNIFSSQALVTPITSKRSIMAGAGWELAMSNEGQGANRSQILAAKILCPVMRGLC